MRGNEEQIALPMQRMEPTPFLKWAGGKGRLLGQLEGLFPREWNGYHEPFVGGGAVFFRLRPEEATLSDVNGRLIELYRVIRDEPFALMERLDALRRTHDQVSFYAARSRFNAPRGLGAVDRAALFVYLNKTCFNGLYRENGRGEFNVPYGRYTAPNLYDRGNVLACSSALQGVELRVEGFESVLDRAQPGDFVYFDPPYVPLSATSSFTGYASGGFGLDMQVRLAQTFDTLARRGCLVMLSNSDAPLVHDLYAGWRIDRVHAPRMINRCATSRGAIAEVVVRSW